MLGGKSVRERLPRPKWTTRAVMCGKVMLVRRVLNLVECRIDVSRVGKRMAGSRRDLLTEHVVVALLLLCIVLDFGSSVLEPVLWEFVSM